VANRLPNPRKAKIHRSYTVEEVARLYDVHRNTVRQWIKKGLPVCDDRRPTLILGLALVEFLTRKRTQNKRPCAPGEIYCVGCRVPQRPALGMVEYRSLTTASGNLIGICPTCESMIFRRVSFSDLAVVSGNLEVSIAQVPDHIVESSAPSVNRDSSPGG